jgi:polyphenol oxidase
MIRPPGWNGAAFSERSDGDMRSDPAARTAVSTLLGVDDHWAEARQVHGSHVVAVDAPGMAGEADGLWTTRRGLPLAVFTADCFGVVLSADEAVGVAHAGWRGAASGIVAVLRESMESAGHSPSRAAVGPGIRPCCFEVGPEVVASIGSGLAAETTWGTVSVDLPAALQSQVSDLEVWVSDACTRHDQGWFSHRLDRTQQRLASIGWLE